MARYTDFLVNEITLDGEVVHLRSTEAPRSASTKTEPVPDKKVPSSELTTQTTTEHVSIEPAGKSAETDEPKAEFEISEADKILLEGYFDATIAQKIVTLYRRRIASPATKAGEFSKIKSAPIDDKDLRTKIHQNVRRIFSGRLETVADENGVMTIGAGAAIKAGGGRKRGNQGGRGERQGFQMRGKLGWNELGGEYLHFSLYKENKDTMEVLAFLARQLKSNPKAFQFAGTKDRRGVTVQRACVFRIHAERMAGFNKSLRNAVLGDFQHQQHGLNLGDLRGNEFLITLRECTFPSIPETESIENKVKIASEIVQKSMVDLHKRGYINYYGLQRFGTFSTRTHTVGIKMLQEKFQGACDLLLHYDQQVLEAAMQSDPAADDKISSDDKARALGIYLFQSSDRFSEALEKLPRRFSAESNLIRHLGRSKTDYLGALQSIPRNLRLMYVHAYQSYVWNFAAGKRLELYGSDVVEGDLVMVNEHKDKTAPTEALDEVDDDGEVIIRPTEDDAATHMDDMFERARALTAEEAASGRYTLFDVVLPLPGFDVIYPPNKMTDFYKDFMASEEGGHLDPFNMKRKWKDISLSGSYRKLLTRPEGSFSTEVKSYKNDDEQFIKTDLELLRENEGAATKEDKDASGENGVEHDKLAVILKLQLGASQYATMALRELMKDGGVKQFRPDFSGAR